MNVPGICGKASIFTGIQHANDIVLMSETTMRLVNMFWKWQKSFDGNCLKNHL